jgi:SAM-dependent methyltransferase
MGVNYQPEGNFYNKYESKNPIARRLMANFLRNFDDLAAVAKVHTAYEVGSGEGNLSFRLAKRGITVRSSDISGHLVEEANTKAVAERLPARFECASIYDLAPDGAGAELVVCCEVLEHLDKPRVALDILARMARPYLLASVPREPVWRFLNVARGAYWRELGNTPGHVQHWSAGGFIEFIKTRFEILAVRTPFPWTMALCKVLPAASSSRDDVSVAAR